MGNPLHPITICHNIVNEGAACAPQDSTCMQQAIAKCRGSFNDGSICLDELKNQINYTRVLSEVQGLNKNIANLNKKASSCQKKKSKTQSCCKNPLSCLSDNEGSNGGGMDMASIMQMAQSLTASASSAKQACELSKNLLLGGAAANVAASKSCDNAVNSCNNECSDVKGEANRLKTNYAEFCGDSRYMAFSEIRSYCKNYDSLAETETKTSQDIATCKKEKEKSAYYQVDATAQALASQTAQKCADYTSAASTGFPDPSLENPSAAFSGDCGNQAYYNDPTCVKCRQNPSDPSCAGLSGVGNNNYSLNSAGTTASPGAREKTGPALDDALGGIPADNGALGDPATTPPGQAGLAKVLVEALVAQPQAVVDLVADLMGALKDLIRASFMVCAVEAVIPQMCRQPLVVAAIAKK